MTTHDELKPVIKGYLTAQMNRDGSGRFAGLFFDDIVDLTKSGADDVEAALKALIAEQAVCRGSDALEDDCPFRRDAFVLNRPSRAPSPR